VESNLHLLLALFFLAQHYFLADSSTSSAIDEVMIKEQNAESRIASKKTPAGTTRSGTEIW
jgi:hypothetical protein